MIFAALLLALGVLLVLSPAEATLGSVVKIVYLHGAMQRVSLYAFVIAGVLGVADLSLRGAQFAAKRSPNRESGVVSQCEVPLAGRLLATLAPHANAGVTESLVRWARATQETAMVFWLAQLGVSLPAQVLAWGTITWNEPRVMGAVWIVALTILVYVVALWMSEARWMSLAAIANAVIVLVVLRGAVNILHPIDPIIASDSLAIKAFYVAIVGVTGVLAFQFARDCANLAKAS
jgi:hypothetical protein